MEAEATCRRQKAVNACEKHVAPNEAWSYSTLERGVTSSENVRLSTEPGFLKKYFLTVVRETRHVRWN